MKWSGLYFDFMSFQGSSDVLPEHHKMPQPEEKMFGAQQSSTHARWPIPQRSMDKSPERDDANYLSRRPKGWTNLTRYPVYVNFIF